MKPNTIYSLALIGALLLPPLAHAGKTDYTDVWWNSQQSGWGMNLARQDNSIYATLHAYDSNGTPLWYVAYLDEQNDNSFAGNIYSFTSTQTNAPLSPSQAKPALQGTLAFVPFSASEGLIRYNINGQQGEQPVKRFSLLSQPFPTSNPITGTNDWEYSHVLFNSHHSISGSCPQLFGFQPPADNITLKITPSTDPTAPFVQIALRVSVKILSFGRTLDTKYRCTVTGHLTSDGRLSKIDDATYSCADEQNGQTMFTLPTKVADIHLSSSQLDGHWDAEIPTLGAETGTQTGSCSQRASFVFSMRP